MEKRFSLSVNNDSKLNALFRCFSFVTQQSVFGVYYLCLTELSQTGQSITNHVLDVWVVSSE